MMRLNFPFGKTWENVSMEEFNTSKTSVADAIAKVGRLRASNSNSSCGPSQSSGSSAGSVVRSARNASYDSLSSSSSQCSNNSEQKGQSSIAKRIREKSKNSEELDSEKKRSRKGEGQSNSRGMNLSTLKSHITGSFLFNDYGKVNGLAKEYLSKKGFYTQEKTEGLSRELLEAHDKFSGPNQSVFYRNDSGVTIVQGKGPYLFDENGTAYLDLANNVAGVGHSNPRVVEAGQAALANIQTNARFLHPNRARYMKKLVATLPKELDTVYLVNSGTEANDLAFRIAKMASTSPNPDHVICIDAAYHGHSQACVDFSPYKWRQCTDGSNYQKPNIHVVQLPDTYRGPFKGFSEASGEAYAEDFVTILNATDGVGCFIHESVLGCGGQIILPPGYLKKAYREVRAKGGICIADEVQTGFGRPGKSFWAFEQSGVVPDIVTMGKPMGNGYPLAAVAVRREIAKKFSHSGIEYFNTTGGNSVACAIGEAVLDCIQEDGLQRHSEVLGEYLMKKLRQIQETYPEWVGDVRGIGLFIGIELVKPKASEEEEVIPHPLLTRFLVDFLRYRRIIVSADGPSGNVIKVKPPLCISKDDTNFFLCTLEDGLEAANELAIF